MIHFMSKFTRFITALLTALILMPSFATLTRAEDDQPIAIKSAVIETKGDRVTGTVKICNSEKERVKFLLDVKNLTINSLYKRSLSVAADDCVSVKLRFNKDFAEMSNVDDRIRLVAKYVSGLRYVDEYDFSNTYETKVIKGAEDHSDCPDQFGEDGIFAACKTGFVYHEPSGLRIRVMDSNTDFVDLRLTHVEWGGVKDMRIYKGRMKKIRSNYDELERVEITNVYGEKGGSDLFLKIES